MQTPSLTLFRHAHLFDPSDRGVVDVLIAAGQVAAIAPHLELPPSSWPCEVLDLQGASLVPGLIDGHVHFAGGGGEAGLRV